LFHLGIDHVTDAFARDSPLLGLTHFITRIRRNGLTGTAFPLCGMTGINRRLERLRWIQKLHRFRISVPIPDFALMANKEWRVDETYSA
jgi:hypothetical protein